MRTIIASCLLAFLAITAEAQSFHNTPLLEALQAISNSQTNYTIDILSDGLGNLHTSANVTGLSVPDAVKCLCKGLPVKVKTKGRVISVQPKKGVPLRREVEISGKVEDGFLKIPLAHVKVSICRADSSVLVDSATNLLGYGHGDRLLYAMYTAKVTTDATHLLVHAQLKGYDDVWQRADIGKRTEVEMPTLEMRKMREIQLGEVVIKSTKVKMFWRGDTIVYDATAFNLPKGSMLDDLIRQMPGVTLNAQGQIFVNGRMVDELLLGSRSFMRGNKRVLMENLPYYTVKEVKVYEKQTDRSVALGYDVDPKRYVMDVNLKQEYQRGYIANVEGAAGNEDRWLGRAFVLAFSDHYRFTLLGNANNVNETRHIGQSDSWTPATMPKNMLTTRSVAGEMSYYAKGDVVKNNLTASYTSTTDVSETRSRYEQFLQGLTPTSLTESANRTGNQRWSAHNELTLKKPFYVFAIADFNYSKNHGVLSSMFQQWTADSLTALQHTDGFSNGKAWNGYIEAQGSVNIGHDQQHVNYYVKAERMENESESARSYSTRQYAAPQQTTQNNMNDISNSTTWGIASLSYSNKISKAVNMQVGEAAYLSRIDAHDWLYHPIDTLLLPSQADALRAVTDVNNSYDSRQNIAENTLSVSFFQNGQYKYRSDLPYTVGYQRWNVGIGIPIRHESLSYQRGSLDTLARQNTVFINASASFRYVPEDGKHDFRVHASHKRSSASLSDRITYRDDSQPLVVKLGNPDLKSSVTSNFGIDYSNKVGRNYQQWHIGASADIYHRQTAQSVSYDLTSGVYTYKPTNVSGAYRLTAKFDLSRTIDKNRYWSWQTNTDAGYHHSIDHAMLTGDTESHVNTVNTLTLHDNAYIQYNKGTLNVRATGDIRWRHSKGKMYDFETLNATDFQYGLSARYTLPRLNTTLSADGNMYSRRGYGSSELNNDDFVLNASVSQPFFKGKLIARIEAFDLLHQLSNTQYTVNAQGRTETWYRSLPHYVMAHLVYHWNKNPKKKQ